MSVRRVDPKPDYTHHCFVVARTARQFFLHTRFEPDQPRVDHDSYVRLIRAVIRRTPRRASHDPEKIVIPGYANLRQFSHDFEAAFKEHAGGAWQSYFQRGHWRMVFPISRRRQEKTARELQQLVTSQPVVLHLVRFPQLTINHAVVVFAAAVGHREIEFAAYDPNAPEKPVLLRYDRTRQTFYFPRTNYFPGGRVDVYRVYSNWCY